MTIEQFIKEAEEIERGVKEGPWRFAGEDDTIKDATSRTLASLGMQPAFLWWENRGDMYDQGNFIAFSRTALPLALAALKLAVEEIRLIADDSEKYLFHDKALKILAQIEELVKEGKCPKKT